MNTTDITTAFITNMSPTRVRLYMYVLRVHGYVYILLGKCRYDISAIYTQQLFPKIIEFPW